MDETNSDGRKIGRHFTDLARRVWVDSHLFSVLRGLAMVHLMTCNLAVLAIAMIYFSYRNAHVAKIKRRRVVQDRVAHMLWTAAHRMK